MANHKSALKRNRQNKKHQERNRSNRTVAKSATQKLRVLLADGKVKAEDAMAALKKATSELTKAAQKGAFHKRRAARKTSRLQKAVNKAS